MSYCISNVLFQDCFHTVSVMCYFKNVFTSLRFYMKELEELVRRNFVHTDFSLMSGGSFVASLREGYNNRREGGMNRLQAEWRQYKEEYGEYIENIRGRKRGMGSWKGRGRGGHRGGYPREYIRGLDSFENHQGNDQDYDEGDDQGDPERDSSVSSAIALADVARKSLGSWEGFLYFKKSVLGTKFHVLEGSSDFCDLCKDKTNQNLLKIREKMRLDDPHLLDYWKMRRISAPLTASIMLCLPTISAPPLTSTFRNLITYLEGKESAGVITFSESGIGPSDRMLYVFPPCTFSLDILRRAAPTLTGEMAKDSLYLVILVEELEITLSDTLSDVARGCSRSWEGSLIMKDNVFGTKFHVLEGTSNFCNLLIDKTNQNLLKITQTFWLDASVIIRDLIIRRKSAPITILLCLPTTPPPMPEGILVVTNPLCHLIATMKFNNIAGTINLSGRRAESSGSKLYVFPPCTFSLDLMRRAVPNLPEGTTLDDHLVIMGYFV